MKKIALVAVIAFCAVMVVFAAGGRQAAPVDHGPFPGVIAIVTSSRLQNIEEYQSAQWLVNRYGHGRIWHLSWPSLFMQEQAQMVAILELIAANPDVRALVINQAVPGTNRAVGRLRETRPDIFIVYATPQEDPVEIARSADLILRVDDFEMGPAIARQAHAQGAQAIVHYSFPRHTSQAFIAGRRDAMRNEALRLGMVFRDVTAPDPMGPAGMPATQQFILEDVPRQVAALGRNTAFFGTNCGMQIPMIRQVVDFGAIYPQPCCPSPFHGFPTALGIPATDDIPSTVDNIRRAVATAGATGRLSTWPVPAAMMFTVAGVEYAIRVINGQAPRNVRDPSPAVQAEVNRVLTEVMNDYVRELLGTTVELGIRSFETGGQTLHNQKLIMIGHLTF